MAIKAMKKYVCPEFFSKLVSSCLSVHSIIKWLCKIKEIVPDIFFHFKFHATYHLKLKYFIIIEMNVVTLWLPCYFCKSIFDFFCFILQIVYISICMIIQRFKSVFFIFSMFLFLLPAKSQVMKGEKRFDKLVIDPGHGGNDKGATGSVSFEKDLTLSISLLVGGLLQRKMPDVEVIYTRKKDRFVPLHKRAEIANKNQADLFISIHCNSILDPDFFGSETYVMGVHKNAENLEVAKAENSAILLEEDFSESYDGFDPDSDEDIIMLNMFQSSSIDHSIRFSMLVQERLKETAGMYDRGVKQAGFVVLYLTTMPGVLIETGFLSNPAEERFLLDPENQLKIAKAIVEAVEAYKIFLEE